MTPIDAELLQILACPETKQPLREAGAALIERLNTLQAEGKLINREGKPVEEMLEGGLIREDGAWLYPIFDGIPALLIDEAIELKEGEAPG